MKELRYTVLADGATDAALQPILTFLLRVNGVNIPIQPSFADLRNLAKPPKDLAERIVAALYLNDTDLLFVHRDSERNKWQMRKNEIELALSKVRSMESAAKGKSKVEKFVIVPPAVCTVPVRMTEAWLFSNEAAIRVAAGNPNGKMPLVVPPLRNVEHLPDPKEVLYDILKTASGLKRRRLKQFSTSNSTKRVAELTEDFSGLRGIPAFDALEAEIKVVLQDQNWIFAKPSND